MALNLSIGNKIAALRKSKGMTQEKLAEKLDISIKHCSSVERGLSCLSLEKLIEVSKIFDVSLDFLIKEDYVVQDVHTQICTELPQSIIEILQSQDEKEISLLQEYLRFYNKIREHTNSTQGKE